MESTTVKNFLWRFFERVGAELVSFIVAVILARLLSPSEYGTLAIVSVVIVFFQVFVDSGMANALIQKKEIDDTDYSTVFYFNMLMCVLLYGILFFIAPLFAEFYQDSSLIAILRVLGIVILISGVKNVQQAYVSRNMLFKKFFFSTLVGTIVAAIVGIAMAYIGYGVWALIVQQIMNTFIDTCVLWFTVKWRPKRLFSSKKLKGMFDYGWKLLATGLLGTLYNNISQLCIGKVYSSSDLAYYNRGKSWPNLLVTNINTSLDSVLLPTFSKKQNDNEWLKEKCSKSIQFSSYLIFPAMIGLATVATPLTRIILTEKWLESVPYLQLFCISFATYPIQTSNINIMKSVGNSGSYLKCEIVKRVIQMIFLVAGLKISVMAVGVSFLLTNLLSWIIFSYPNKKIIGYGFFEQFKDLLPTIVITVLMAIVVMITGRIPINQHVVFALQVLCGVTSYILFSRLTKNNVFNIICELIKNKINK